MVLLIDCMGQSMSGTSDELPADAIRHAGQMDANLCTGQDSLNQVSALPPLCDLDVGVIQNLPPDLFSELNGIYGGKLVDLIGENKGKCEKIRSSSCNPPHEPEGVMNEGSGSLLSDLVNLNRGPVEIKAENHAVEDVHALPVIREGLFNEAFPTLVHDKVDLMPSSLSQIDTSVFQQLPEQVKADIVELLPEHRRQALSSDAALSLPENLLKSIKTAENSTASIDDVGNDNLWVGNPPLWVNKFKASNFLILNILADIYNKSGSTKNLSQILQCTVSVTLHPPDASSDGWDEAVDTMCELLRQYIKLKIEVDIEEIYVCFRLLRRIMWKSEFFLQVYNVVVPYLQASVGQNYGGMMHV